MFEIAVAVAEETRPWEGRVFSVCVVGLVNEGMATIHKKMSPFREIAKLLLQGFFRTFGAGWAARHDASRCTPVV
jgi:hypothetical protein